MPNAWTDKDERQYEKIRESSLNRGIGEDPPEEIAARTLNNTRRRQGRTPNPRTSGTGNPNLNLEVRTKDEVYNIARDIGIDGRSKMTKSQLVRAIRSRR